MKTTRTKSFYLILTIVLQAACLDFKVISEGSWKVPDTDLQIMISKEKTTRVKTDTVERELVLRENYLKKTAFQLQRTGNNFSRVNVYRTAEKIFLVRDAFETYELNTETKNLRRITPTDAGAQKFVGTFDDNGNGKWQYIPAAERGEILLGTSK